MRTRILFLTLSIVCTLASAYFAIIDYWLNSENPAHIRRAAYWAPMNAEAWRRMTIVEPERAAEHWHRVLQLTPRNTQARYALAQEAEQAGDAARAERWLMEAATYDKGYQPAWALANFYLRQNREGEFWRWARRAASFEVDLSALFALAMRVQPDPAALETQLLVRRPAAMRQLLAAANERGLLKEALPVAQKIAALKTASAGEQLLWSADRLIERGDLRSARAYWDLAGTAGALPYPVNAAPGLVNGEFAKPSLERGFDWRPGSAEISVNIAGSLHASLYGKQDDTAVIARQLVMVEPGGTYQLRYRYRTVLPAAAHPVMWRLGNVDSPALESAAGDWREAIWRFQAPRAGELELITRRAPGTHRAPGEVEIAWVQLEAVEPSQSASAGPTRSISTFAKAAPKKPTNKL